MVLAEKLSELAGLHPEHQELLETVGVDRVSSLAQSDPTHIHREIMKANGMLRIASQDVAEEMVIGWVAQAKEKVGDRASVLSFAKPVNTSSEERPVTSPAVVSEAVPVSPQKIKELGLQASEVPVMEVFFEEEGAISAEAQLESVDSSVDATTQQAKQTVGAEKKAFVLPQEDEETPRQKVEPLQGKGRSALTAPSPGLNAGKKEYSRSYIRGVLHPRPGQVRFGAICAILGVMAVPVMVLGLLLIMSLQSLWMAVVSGVGLLFGLVYLIFAMSPRCRICGQPLFVPKRCRRHVKAHRFPLLGYIMPTSLQLLFFKWFRCIYCGTAVRLKE